MASRNLPTELSVGGGIWKHSHSMEFLDLFLVALVPVLETLFITLLGLLIATQRLNLLRTVESRNCLNKLVFYIFCPALIVADLAETITFQRLIETWFMVVNIFLTIVVGSILGWILNKIARTPHHLRGLVNGLCGAGNLGNMPLIIVPAVCEQNSSIFGDSSTCSAYGDAYAAVSAGLSSVFIWTYLFIVMGVSTDKNTENKNTSETMTNATYSTETLERFPVNITQSLLTSTDSEDANLELYYKSNYEMDGLCQAGKILYTINICSGKHCDIIGLAIGAISPIQKLMVGDSAPLRFVLMLQYALPPAAIIGTVVQMLGVGESECSLIMIWTYAIATLTLTLWCTFFMWILQ
ncbi:unnamed protein product [Sphenostylis stenocarpa]|uniref:Uncharacterized protein n=1 Tax=Sphenostylis stenocarpa TaxID=92480 RepID=A0AA86S593_9FABA|nr:unnamed protein product [Sphenostylis stenocarpa]